MSQEGEQGADTVREVVRHAARFAFTEAKSRQALLQLSWGLAAHTDDRLKQVDQVWGELARASPSVPKIACQRGCAFCCYLRVSVYPVEAIRIAEYAERKFSAEERAQLAQRLRSYAESIGRIEGGRKLVARLPCAFLKDNECSIYEARPSVCRSHHSLDVIACESGHHAEDNSPVPQVAQRSDAAKPIVRGLADACRDAGLTTDALELSKAMLVALETPDAAERWLAGEDVFALARDEEITTLISQVREPR